MNNIDLETLEAYLDGKLASKGRRLFKRGTGITKTLKRGNSYELLGRIDLRNSKIIFEGEKKSRFKSKSTLVLGWKNRRRSVFFTGGGNCGTIRHNVPKFHGRKFLQLSNSCDERRTKYILTNSGCLPQPGL